MINPKKAGMWMVVIIMFILLGQIALAQSGSLKSWGYNYYGQLGDGTTTDRHTPVSVSGGITTAVSVSAGLEHTCAVLSDHTVKCWGYNDNGQLGDGTTTNSLTPVSVSGITNAINVSTSYKHTCAVLSDHTVKCWGYNDFGQLGDNTIIDKHIPVIVSGITTAVSVSVGAHHTCAVLSGGTIKCWGYNVRGQLGDNTIINRLIPVIVSGITTAVSVSAGQFHTCAVLSDHTIKCWGYDYMGLLGDGLTTDRHTPVSVSGITNAVSVSAGYSHTCAVLSDHTVKCWGNNNYGQLGDNTIINRLIPVSVNGITNAVSVVSASAQHSCAVLSSGAIKCWGQNYYGNLGDDTTTDSYTPVSVSGITTAVSISSGYVHIVAIINCACSDTSCNPSNNGQKCDGCNYADVSSAAETCDGIDNNCDGQTDEGLTVPSQTCYAGVGACRMSGTEYKTCNGASGWSSTYSGCTAAAGAPAAETCNNIDDDCNGQTDEGLTPPACNQQGACSGAFKTCNAGVWSGCSILPSAEVCNDGIDNNCDGLIDAQDQVACPCTLTNAYWSTASTTAGSKVTMAVEGTNCDGKQADFDIYEDDLFFDEGMNDEFVLNPTAVFIGGKAETFWYAIYMPDGVPGFPTLFDPPEYYFNAKLDSKPSTLLKSQGPAGSHGLLSVMQNQPPTQPTPFLISPNGGESYDQNAVITWNPAVDPEEDSIVYSLYYSDDSGATWHFIDETSETSYLWDTSLLQGKTTYKVMLVAEEIAVCGNGKMEAAEQCDDGNTISGDGCSAACAREVANCGDSICTFGETCIVDNCCNGATVSLQTDQAHCGSCTNVCAANQICQAGVCIIPSAPMLSCVYKAGTCDAGYTKVLEASGLSDAHASLPGLSSFGYNICCKVTGAADNTLTTACGTTFLQLSTPSNDAHVQVLGAGGFINNACMKANAGILSCGYAADCAAAGYNTCLASITDTADAHIGQCSAYSTKVCCKVIPQSPSVCGNNLKELTESCDGTDLGGQTCISRGFTRGTLACMVDCSGFITSGCSSCGDGTKNPEEECDDGNKINGDGCSADCKVERPAYLSNLVAYWNFNEGNGTIIDDKSINNNVGNIFGATWITGKFDGALSFGGNNYVEIADNPSLDVTPGNQITIEYWVKINSLPGEDEYNEVLRKVGSYFIILSNLFEHPPEFRCVITDNWIGDVYSGEVTTNTWYYVACTYDGSKVRLYLNGQLKATSGTFTTGNMNSANILSLGKLPGDSRYFNGVMDEAAIYNVALTDSQIANNYNNWGIIKTKI